MNNETAQLLDQLRSNTSDLTETVVKIVSSHNEDEAALEMATDT